MGRTLPSAAILLMQEKEKFKKFKRALSRRDELALDDLFAFANQHVAEVSYAAYPLPMEMYLLVMILEQHKEVMELQEKVDLYARSI